MSRNKNNRGRRQNNSRKPQQSQRSASQTPTSTTAQRTEPVTVADVTSSDSAAEFEAKKKTLIQQLLDEIKSWEDERDAAKHDAEECKSSLADLEQEKQSLTQSVASLREELKQARADLAEANSTVQSATDDAERIRAEADSYAEETRRAADEERLSTLTEANAQAKAAWKAQADDLAKQIEDIAAREKELAAAKREVDREKRFVDDDREALAEMKEDLEARKRRYDSASPAVVTGLQTELADERAKYAVLQERYATLSRDHAELQAYVDSIKSELEGSDGESVTISVGEIISSFRKLREEHARLAGVYEVYPDSDAIAALEEEARRAEALASENAALRADRDRYRDEAVAADNERQELRATRRAAIATHALNDHLLHELESHKAALESRTGDTCISLTQVDVEVEAPSFTTDITSRTARSRIDSLRDLVSHVRQYAGSREGSERLYYTDNDIRAFLAGMAVSHLVILQGMSGTGKSSLPRIFSEAISGFNKLIPVESSWRDRNELLGYYNDFNKKFNAKTFTIELYRSGKECCRDIPTFIVLDEMNLARIEYYFSDFLAILQEPDHEKWLVELVSSDMRSIPMTLPEDVRSIMEEDEPTLYSIWERIERSRNGDADASISDRDRDRLYGYLGRIDQLMGAKDLVDGRKIRVTDNVWFIGTANRDESTFEISDKVYDRAQVVSLNKRGVPDGHYSCVSPRYISASDLQRLFDAAIKNGTTQAEVIEKLEELDDVLTNKFDTSFGNRIVSQTVSFAAVFVAAGGTLTDALDYQISTKIIRKVITSDDEEALLDLLDAVEDYAESARLVEKRLRELRN